MAWRGVVFQIEMKWKGSLRLRRHWLAKEPQQGKIICLHFVAPSTTVFFFGFVVFRLMCGIGINMSLGRLSLIDNTFATDQPIRYAGSQSRQGLMLNILYRLQEGLFN